MSKTLVAYFSATGTTAKLAEKVAEAAKGDIFEIVPAEKYGPEDLDWTNPKSRSSVEMKDGKSRPKIDSKVKDMDSYDTIYLGFPIWWYVAPRIVNTFLEDYDLSGKTINVFVTSGGSGLGDTIDGLKESAEGAVFGKAERMSAGVPQCQVDDWVSE